MNGPTQCARCGRESGDEHVSGAHCPKGTCLPPTPWRSVVDVALCLHADAHGSAPDTYAEWGSLGGAATREADLERLRHRLADWKPSPPLTLRFDNAVRELLAAAVAEHEEEDLKRTTVFYSLEEALAAVESGAIPRSLEPELRRFFGGPPCAE